MTEITRECEKAFGYPPTPEQQKILWEGIYGDSEIMKILAFAGTGKTSTLKMLARFVEGKKLYLAFNRSIAEEASASFVGTNTTVKTTHALAYQYVIRPGGYEIKGGYSVREVADLFDCEYSVASTILKEFERFMNSSRLDFFDLGESEKATLSTKRRSAMNGAKQMYEMMLGQKIPFSQSASLKTFHLRLASGNITFPSEFSLLMLDEGQDTNSVTLSIFYLIPAKKRVIVGDRHQQIYSFRGSQNAMNRIHGKVSTFALTHSFRFVPEIGEKATSFLSMTRGEKLFLVGKGKPCDIKMTAWISRGNPTLIRAMDKLIKDGEPFRTVRDPWSIFGLAINLLKLQDGEELDREYRYLYGFLRELGGSRSEILSKILASISDPRDEVVRTIRLIFDIPNIRRIYGMARRYYEQDSEDFKLFLTTAHTSKGLEWDRVYVENDFVGPEIIAKWFYENGIDPDGNLTGKKGEELDMLDYFTKNCRNAKYTDELNIYYVAITRAKTDLIDNSVWGELGDDRKKVISIIRSSYRSMKKKEG